MDLSKIANAFKHLPEIWEGTVNTVFLKQAVEKTAYQRLQICRKCDYNSKYGGKKVRGPESCRYCGCFLKIKTRSMASSCPLPEPRWVAVPGITQEQSEEIDKIVGNE